ncbi:hypothetical protein C8035_v005040 [Colletotrichum spinosum]|uniref:Azaphilone pigments biosynthesis cluster protein L N-terminal domain-containing protein n=1 Tax=Colletotrichum spinosum TaxID=1347390 RepID=A0A4R8QQP3_9PEZI|nr:hypothetical protein C8035_v005040 [Colletotrichum spinosum]
MDPLSITASVVTLVEAAGIVTKSLHGFVLALRTADDRLNGLCDEMMHLTEFLLSVGKLSSKYDKQDLDLVEEDLWSQSDSAIDNCEITLNELKVLVGKISDGADSKRFGWKAKVVIDLSRYGNEISTLRDKIHKSNCALQTILLTINVRSDARVDRNLRALANAASRFHSTASSTASSSRGGSEALWRPSSVPDASISGHFLAATRERVERFIGESPSRSQQSSPETANPPSTLRSSPASLLDPANQPDQSDQEEDEKDEYEMECVTLLQKLAVESIESHEFVKAGDILKEALARQRSWASTFPRRESGSLGRALKTQLAVCYFFQGNWQLAEPIVRELSAAKRDRHLVECNLLHALALAHLSEYLFEEALEACKQALHGQRRVAKRGCSDSGASDVNNSIGLLATIHDMKGDYIAAELHRRQLPPDFQYHHPRHGREYLAKHQKFIAAVFPDNTLDLRNVDMPVSLALISAKLQAHTDSGIEMDYSPLGEWEFPLLVSPKGQSPLKLKEDQHRRLETDTSKEVFTPASQPESSTGNDDTEKEVAKRPVVTVESYHPVRRMLNRMFSTMTMRSPHELDDFSIGHNPASPAGLSTPVTRWHFHFGHAPFNSKKSKKLSKKRPKGVQSPIARVLHWRNDQQDTSDADLVGNIDQSSHRPDFYAPQTKHDRDSIVRRPHMSGIQDGLSVSVRDSTSSGFGQEVNDRQELQDTTISELPWRPRQDYPRAPECHTSPHIRRWQFSLLPRLVTGWNLGDGTSAAMTPRRGARLAPVEAAELDSRQLHEIQSNRTPGRPTTTPRVEAEPSSPVQPRNGQEPKESPASLLNGPRDQDRRILQGTIEDDDRTAAGHNHRQLAVG